MASACHAQHARGHGARGGRHPRLAGRAQRAVLPRRRDRRPAATRPFRRRTAPISRSPSAATRRTSSRPPGARRRALVIRTAWTCPASGHRCRRARPTILTVARIQERYKGHDVLVRALALVRAKVPAAQWVVIGDGSLRPGIEQLARSYGVSQACRFLGAVSDEQRDDLAAPRERLRDAQPAAGGRPGRGGLRHRLPRGGRLRQAGRGGRPRRRARRGARRRDGAAGRPDRSAPRRRGDHRACCSTASSPERLGASGRSARAGARLAALVARVRTCCWRSWTFGRPGGAPVRRAARGAITEGPVRQPHGDGQRRRALAARPARRAAREVQPRLAAPGGRCVAAPRLGVPCSAIAGTAGASPSPPAHAGALAEMAAAAAQVVGGSPAHGADLAHANSIRAGIVSAWRGSRRSPGCAGAQAADARARARLPAAGRGEHGDAAPDRGDGDPVVRQLGLHGRVPCARRRRGRGSRSCYNPVDLARFDPAALDRRARRPAGRGVGRRRLLLGVVAQLTPWKGQDTAIERSGRCARADRRTDCC